MVFIAAGVILTIPLRWAIALWPEKPKRICGGSKSFSINDPSRQTYVTFSGPLIKITLLSRFKSAGILKNHLRNGTDIHKIQAFSPDPVHPYIPHHQHPKLSLTLCLCPHQSGK